MLDTDPDHVSKNTENAIVLPKWRGDPKDKGLIAMIPFLECVQILFLTLFNSDCDTWSKAIAIYNPPDVRPIIKAYEGKDLPLEYAKAEAKAKAKHIAEWNAKQKPEDTAPSFRNLFGLASFVCITSFSLWNLTFKHLFFRLRQKENLHQHILSESGKRLKETINWSKLRLNNKRTIWREAWRNNNELLQLRCLATFWKLWIGLQVIHHHHHLSQLLLFRYLRDLQNLKLPRRRHNSQDISMQNLRRSN